MTDIKFSKVNEIKDKNKEEVLFLKDNNSEDGLIIAVYDKKGNLKKTPTSNTQQVTVEGPSVINYFRNPLYLITNYSSFIDYDIHSDDGEIVNYYNMFSFKPKKLGKCYIHINQTTICVISHLKLSPIKYVPSFFNNFFSIKTFYLDSYDSKEKGLYSNNYYMDKLIKEFDINIVIKIIDVVSHKENIKEKIIDIMYVENPIKDSDLIIDLTDIFNDESSPAHYINVTNFKDLNKLKLKFHHKNMYVFISKIKLTHKETNKQIMSDYSKRMYIYDFSKILQQMFAVGLMLSVFILGYFIK